MTSMYADDDGNTLIENTWVLAGLINNIIRLHLLACSVMELLIIDKESWSFWKAVYDVTDAIASNIILGF